MVVKNEEKNGYINGCGGVVAHRNNGNSVLASKTALSTDAALTKNTAVSNQLRADTVSANPVSVATVDFARAPSPIYFALGTPLGSLWMQVIMAAVLAVLIVVKRKNLFEELLVG